MTDLKAHIDQANSEREFFQESIAGASAVTVDSDYTHYTVGFAGTAGNSQ